MKSATPIWVAFLLVCMAALVLPAMHAVPARAAEAAGQALAVWDQKIEFPAETVQVRYDKALATLVNQPFDPGAGWNLFKVVTTKLKAGTEETFLVVFDPGPSADPNFQVYRGTDVGEDNYLGSMNGLELSIPGDGFLYVSGHSNTTFNQRRKYQIAGHGMEEIAQPFYYVGLQSKTLKPVTLTSEVDGGAEVATLPAGAPVEILLNRDDNRYLVRTQDGLVGWFTEELTTQDPVHFEGLYFRGD
ncbi:MAG: hypothetical protein IT365_15515 [Candidatus Hydrogenedentes bacterium]|nr:hypothetical protein [Candidatus Hydrogenedentota bacterium]